LSLELDCVSFAYPGTVRTVISELSLTLALASSAAVIGPSGSGKSTLLALAGGLLKPDSGTVKVGGELLTGGRRSRHSSSRVGWVHQNLRSLNGRTALDNVGVSLLAQGRSRSEAEPIARQSLAAVGLEAFVERKTQHLSGGQLQRVAVARAIASRPRLLLADEPTGHLDAEASVTVIRAFLGAAAQLNVTILMATHDMEIAAMCDSLVRL